MHIRIDHQVWLAIVGLVVVQVDLAILVLGGCGPVALCDHAQVLPRLHVRAVPAVIRAATAFAGEEVVVTVGYRQENRSIPNPLRFHAGNLLPVIPDRRLFERKRHGFAWSVKSLDLAQEQGRPARGRSQTVGEFQVLRLRLSGTPFLRRIDRPLRLPCPDGN